MNTQFVRRQGGRFQHGARNPAAEQDRRERFAQYVNEVKRTAYGNWEAVFRVLAPKLEPALNAGPSKHVFCPVHGGTHGDAFRVLSDFQLTGGTCCNTCGANPDGFATLGFLYGWQFSKAVREVGAVLGLRYGNGYVAETAPRVRTAQIQKREEDPEAIRRKDAKRIAEMVELWNGGVPLNDPSAGPARLYLRNRGLAKAVGPLADLRYHPAIPYWENNVEQGTYPGMLRMLRQDNGRTMTIERLYLTEDGQKAPVEKQKKVMPKPSTAKYHGSAVRLDHDDTIALVMAVAEGVETALSFRALSGLPTWAATAAGLLEELVIPSHVELIVIAADKDLPQVDAQGRPIEARGQSAAKVLAERLRAAGKKVLILPPPFQVPEGKHKLDWNDVLCHLGLEKGRQLQVIHKLRATIQHELQELGYEDWRSASGLHY